MGGPAAPHQRASSRFVSRPANRDGVGRQDRDRPDEPRKPDLSGRAFEDTSGAEIIQETVPGARVVKAFNTVFASRQAEPTEDGIPIDGLVAGDDA